MNITIIDNVHLRIDNVHYMLYSTIVNNICASWD